MSAAAPDPAVGSPEGAPGRSPTDDEPLVLAVLADPNSVHTRRWIAFFADRGHRVHLLVADGLDLEPGLPPAIALERYRSYGRRLRPLGALRARRSLRAILARIEPDVLHCHGVTRYGWLGLLAGFQPLLVTAWGSDVLLTPRRSASARLLARLVLRRAALVTAVSGNVLAAAMSLGARPERTRLVQFGIDPGVFAPGADPARLRQALGLEARRVVFAPRAIAPLYRQDVVVAALTRLPKDVAAILSSHNAQPASLSALRSEITARGLEDRVRFVGLLDEAAMAEHYHLADVVVSVPESDAFSATALEAMACGRPLVLSDLPANREGLAELSGPARSGVTLVPVGDEVRTAEAIAAALAIPVDLRGPIGRELRAAAIRRADRARELGAMENLYRGLAGSARHR